MHDALMVNDQHEQLVIAYHLILDNKRIWNDGETDEREGRCRTLTLI